MMFSQTLFAEVPFSEKANPPHVEGGWIKDCKDPCQKPGWSVKQKSSVSSIECGENTTNWTPTK